MSLCAHIGCPAEGTARPVLQMRPRGYAGEPAEVFLGIVVCWQHQVGKVAADFITDEGWAKITAAFQGRVPPDRASTTLRWRAALRATEPER